MKTSLFAVLLLAACGNPKSGDSTTPSGSNTEPPPPMKDTRSEFEKRLDAACNALGPTLTTCAVADANEKLRKGEITQKQFDDVTQPGIVKKLDEEWREKCYQPTKLSSRQVRVLEVCKQAETECEPLLDCLKNFTPTKPAG